MFVRATRGRFVWIYASEAFPERRFQATSNAFARSNLALVAAPSAPIFDRRSGTGICITMNVAGDAEAGTGRRWHLGSRRRPAPARTSPA